MLEIVGVEATDVEEGVVRESEIAETAIENPAPEEALVEVAAPVSEELVATQIVEAEPAVGFFERILGVFVAESPVAEETTIAEIASEPVPEIATPEPIQEIIEDISPESTVEIVGDEEADAEEAVRESGTAEAPVENLAPVASGEVLTPVSEELVAEVAPAAEPSVMEEGVELAVKGSVPATSVESTEVVAEIILADVPVPLAPIRPVEVVVEITPDEGLVLETPAEPVEVAVEIAPAEEPAIREVVAEESLAAEESVDEVDEAPSLRTTIADAFTSFLAGTIGFTRDPEQLEGVETEEVEIVEQHELAEPVIPVETVVEITPAGETVPDVPAGPVEVAVEAVPAEEVVSEAPADSVEVAVEAVPIEEVVSEAPAEPVEVAVETTSAEEPTFGEILIEESLVVEEQSPVLVAEESTDEVDEPPSLQTTIGNVFASFFAATIGSTQDSEQLEIAEVEETEIVEQPEPIEQVDPIVPIELAASVESVEPDESVELTAPIEPVEPVELAAPVEPAELVAPIEPVDVIEFAGSDDGLSIFEQVAVTDLEETDYASGDIFASIASEDTSETPQTGGLTDLALFQAPPEQGSFDPYPDSTIEAPGETLLAMGEVFTADENETYPTSSGEFGRHDPAPDPNNPPQGIFGGKKGISLFNTNPLGSTSEDVITGLSVNSFLWRATLDVLAFMPLASADPFGGVIITEWHNNPQAPDERFKVVAYILDKDLRVGALRVSVFRQERNSGDIWADAVTDENIHIQLETAILSRARDLRAAWLEQQDGG